ncbi:SUMF1/EgtB/PvdO family nonheme iron enzyme [Candidatus Uabimicrobium amorphum]|uniref:Uncharacterized protein n=1 Tax=Uabimicrobium amorphum TaxID=2596890 RepID=A0A5S9IU93_UABAM|nr:SUMF1/EgtB/PvdO family nonheme iron enzyme [Candidatus Uabimicrobium amorphum]BBM87270.1 hypothetical protein UABAM_05673 [Candidatus Uabimicrobium amorphum]
MKKIFLLLCLFTFIYSDGLTFDKIKKFKLKFGFNDMEILAEVKTAGGVERIPGIYGKLLRLGIREDIVEQMLSVQTLRTQLPPRIAKHYKKRMVTPKIRVLAVGINTYLDNKTFPTLQSATFDAEDFIKELLNLGVPTTHVELLTDHNATQKNIVAAIERLARYDETIYVFFSGHGLNIEGDFYLSCHDTQKDKIAETTYAMARLKQKLSLANCKHSVVFLDACHSGASKNARFNTKPKERRNSVVQDMPEELESQQVSLLWDQRGRNSVGDLKRIEKPIFLMVSCGANQVSLQGQGTKNSVFTHYLLEGMRGKADKNNDKNINTLELSGYVRDKVFESTFRQKPDFSVSNGWEKEHCEKAGIYISDLAEDIPEVTVSADELAWMEKQEKMQKNFEYIVAKVDRRRISSKSKIRYWNKFLSMYQNFANPYSEDDEELKNKARERIAYWKKKSDVRRIVRLEVTPQNTRCKVSEQVHFSVVGIRANGERYTPQVLWRAQYGKINKSGWYTAPNRKGSDKVMAMSKEDSRIKKVVRIEVEPKVTGTPGFTFLREKTYSCGGQTHTMKEYRHTRTGMEFVLIRGGSFRMGSNDGDDDEKPVHRVRVNSFLMAKYEVTQDVWQRVMGNNPSHFRGSKFTHVRGDKLPVERVSWTECKSFCDKLGMRLPTEAEWEYACRAGTSSKYYWGNTMDGDYAWYLGNSSRKTHEVGQKSPNAFGLYDMTGNVWEWCADWYDSNYYASSPANNPQGASSGSNRSERGNGWYGDAGKCRSANRIFDKPGYRSSVLGFRPCVTWAVGN